MEKYDQHKIFVTGVSGSGKTTFAKRYAELFDVPYLDFDANWHYGSEDCGEFLAGLDQRFVIDAIPYSDNDAFVQYFQENQEDIRTVCVCCTNRDEWERRVQEKPFRSLFYSYVMFYGFYFYTLRLYSTFNTVYYDSFTDEFIDQAELYKRIEWLPQVVKKGFKEYLDQQIYDKYYQDIEFLDFVGYVQSYKTWETIKDLVDWEGKTVADLGCFHCYFSIKAARAGAIVTSLDINETVLETSKIINELEGWPIHKIERWEGGEEISSDYDIVLCLNVLHHFADVELALKNILAKTVIFEVNQSFIPIIKKEFTIVKACLSHRKDRDKKDRIILVCTRHV